MPSYSDMRLLAVHAHPDDESSKGAATIAHYRRLGVEVMVVTCTGGESGSILNTAMDSVAHARRDLAGYRRQEMARAAEALDIRHRWLGYTDSGLPEGDPLPPLPPACFALQPVDRAAAPLIRLVREFRPHVILTYDENGGYPHPDHIQSHNVAMRAWQKAGDPEHMPELGQAWQPLKLYYDRAFDLERLQALHEALSAKGLESPFAERIARRLEARDTEGNDSAPNQHVTTTKVHCADCFPVRDDALRAHATQVAPESWFFAMSPQDQAAAWPWEDYVRAETRVSAALPETCLFTGIVDEIQPDPEDAPTWQI